MERRLTMISFLRGHPSARQLWRMMAFTLVELLVVMAIVAIIAALAVPAITSVVQGNNLTRAGQQVADQINLARQISSAKNATVELRILKLSGSTIAGYTELQMGTNSYVTTATTPTWVPITHAILLPQNMAISANTTLSSAFSSSTAFTMPTTGYGSQSGASYYPIEFRPSGIVTPVLGMSSYCLAIVPVANLSATALTSLKNYVIIQINPLTSTPIVYRP